MISEIVSNGMLSLPSSLAVVGIVPGVILIIFLGLFALSTAWILIRFKQAHAGVHSMGDAGMVMFGPIGREILMFGTIVFAIAATSGQLLAGQLALSEISDDEICSVLFVLVFAAASFLVALTRTLGGTRWLAVISYLDHSSWDLGHDWCGTSSCGRSRCTSDCQFRLLHRVSKYHESSVCICKSFPILCTDLGNGES